MSFPRYPKYKESGVEWLGEVPEHWQVMRLASLSSKITNGYVGPTRDILIDDGVQYLQSLHIKGNRVRFDVPYFVSEEWSNRHAKSILSTGDVLIVQTGDIGQVAVVPNEFAGCNCHALIIVSPIREVVGGEWISWQLNSEYGLHTLLSIQTGALHPHLNCSDVKDIAIPVPSQSEQSVIVGFLDRETSKIDSLVAEQRRLIELLKEKRQAVISHAVTKGLNPHAPMKPSGIEWLGDVPEHWEIGPLKRYWSVTDCKHITAEFVEGGIPLASIREVQSRWVKLEDAKCTTEHFYQLLIEGNRQPLPGDLIFSRNATVGEVAQVHGDHPRFAMGQDVCLLRKCSLDQSSDYLQHVIRSPIIIQQLANLMIGSTFKRINVEEIRSFVVPSPPSLEQRKIAEFLESEVHRFNALTAEAERGIELLQERRTALISAVVTGKIDVRGFVAA